MKSQALVATMAKLFFAKLGSLQKYHKCVRGIGHFEQTIITDINHVLPRHSDIRVEAFIPPFLTLAVVVIKMLLYT